MNLQEIMWGLGIAYNLFMNRGKISKFMMKYKVGRIILGIVCFPYLVYIIFRILKFYKDHPELANKTNPQMKLSDFY